MRGFTHLLFVIKDMAACKLIILLKGKTAGSFTQKKTERFVE
jgi:hypothetical protein